MDLWRPVVAFVGFMVPACAIAAIVVGLLSMGACASWGSAAKQASDAGSGFWSALTGAGNAPSYAIVGILAGFCLIVAVGTAFASIWVPLIPRKAAVAALLMSIGLFALHRLLQQYLGLLVLLTVIGAVVAGAPLLFAFVRRGAAKYGEQLSVTHPAEGVAMQAWANPKINRVRKEAFLHADAKAKAKRRVKA